MNRNTRQTFQTSFQRNKTTSSGTIVVLQKIGEKEIDEIGNVCISRRLSGDFVSFAKWRSKFSGGLIESTRRSSDRQSDFPRHLSVPTFAGAIFHGGELCSLPEDRTEKGSRRLAARHVHVLRSRVVVIVFLLTVEPLAKLNAGTSFRVKALNGNSLAD